MSKLKLSAEEAANAEQFKDELRAASASFRKKSARHKLRTREAIYCAFSTPRFTVTREESQRDAERRLERFGIGIDQVRGKRVLDLGCNNGAMLFQVSNLEPDYALGVEYDAEKVDLAKRIAAFAQLKNLEFRAGDIDQTGASDLGAPFDVVLCLAIEAHVRNPGHLYELLAAVTRGTLYFEANGSTPPADVATSLQKVGFSRIEHLGACDDDIVPRNNRRPLFSALKS